MARLNIVTEKNITEDNKSSLQKILLFCTVSPTLSKCKKQKGSVDFFYHEHMTLITFRKRLK